MTNDFTIVKSFVIILPTMKTTPHIPIRTKVGFVLFDMLDLLEDALFLSSRPSYGCMCGYWGYTELRSAYRVFERWQKLEYLEKVRRGDQILFRLGPKGRQILTQRRPSAARRDRHWDGKWRMVVFDFPEAARKARDAFRGLLRQHRMGCLQKSVWITPDSVIEDWKRLLREIELTDWVLLFESAELGPVDDLEIARRIWALGDLEASYRHYLTEFQSLPKRLRSAGAATLQGDLGQFVRRESQKYFGLLAKDPMLPRALLPPDFAGLKADALHDEIRAALRTVLFGTK